MDENPTPQTSTPVDAMTQLQVAATAAHEYFLELQRAGFIERQALYLVGQLITAGTRA